MTAGLSMTNGQWAPVFTPETEADVFEELSALETRMYYWLRSKTPANGDFIRIGHAETAHRFGRSLSTIRSVFRRLVSLGFADRRAHFWKRGTAYQEEAETAHAEPEGGWSYFGARACQQVERGGPGQLSGVGSQAWNGYRAKPPPEQLPDGLKKRRKRRGPLFCASGVSVADTGGISGADGGGISGADTLRQANQAGRADTSPNKPPPPEPERKEGGATPPATEIEEQNRHTAPLPGRPEPTPEGGRPETSRYAAEAIQEEVSGLLDELAPFSGRETLEQECATALEERAALWTEIGGDKVAAMRRHARARYPELSGRARGRGGLLAVADRIRTALEDLEPADLAERVREHASHLAAEQLEARRFADEVRERNAPDPARLEAAKRDADEQIRSTALEAISVLEDRGHAWSVELKEARAEHSDVAGRRDAMGRNEGIRARARATCRRNTAKHVLGAINALLERLAAVLENPEPVPIAVVDCVARCPEPGSPGARDWPPSLRRWGAP